jgi:hypothetical protein
MNKNKLKIHTDEMREEGGETFEELYDEYEKVVNMYIMNFIAPPGIWWKSAKTYFRPEYHTWLSRNCHSSAFRSAFEIHNQNMEISRPRFDGVLKLKKKHFKIVQNEEDKMNLLIYGIGAGKKIQLPITENQASDIRNNPSLCIKNGIILKDAVIIRFQ